MKKMLLVVMALLIAAPAMAAVTLSTTVDNPNKKVTISYNDTGVVGSTKARAFALKISVDNGAIITAVSAAAIHANGANYGIYPGRIAIDGTNGTVTNYNDPVELNNINNGFGGASALNTNQVIIAMGSLYQAGGTAPLAAGQLVTVTVDKACTMTIVPEKTARGGVIAENAEQIIITNANETVTGTITDVVLDCYKTTAPDYAAWVTAGKPNCWCFQRQCRGDINGIKSGPYWVSSLDLTLFKAAFNKTDALLPAGGICADLNHTKAGPYRVSSLDLTIFKTYFNKAETLVPTCADKGWNESWKN